MSSVRVIFFPNRLKPATKGYYLAMQNYHIAKLVQVRHRFFVAQCLGDPTHSCLLILYNPTHQKHPRK
jgi:hypothetical protein